jgi:hypothetical protein
MPQTNSCFGENHSCSACCGLHNLALSGDEKKTWLRKNTRDFLALEKPDRKTLLAFRRSGEAFLQNLAIRHDVYNCPFIGLINTAETRTGCLLHKDGSPHPEIRNLDSARCCSFYGESICQTYDCLAKQGGRHSGFPALVQAVENYSSDFLTYGKLACNHNLVQIVEKLCRVYPEIRDNLVQAVIHRLDITEIPATSFEMPLAYEFFTPDDLWSVLGMLFENRGYVFEVFEITPSGITLGRQLRKKVCGKV